MSATKEFGKKAYGAGPQTSDSGNRLSEAASSAALSSKSFGANGAGATSAAGDRQIPVDGFNQVLEMLKIADPTFRESLLKRLAQRDPRLAADLRADLRILGL